MEIAPLSNADRRVLLAEWCHCEEAERADALYEVIADGPVGLRAPLVLIGVWSASLGWATSALGWHPDVHVSGLPASIGGAGLGVVIGLTHVWMRTGVGPLSWGRWLALVLPGPSIGRVLRVGLLAYVGVLIVSGIALVSELRGSTTGFDLGAAVALILVFYVCWSVWLVSECGLVLGLPAAATLAHLATIVVARASGVGLAWIVAVLVTVGLGGSGCALRWGRLDAPQARTARGSLRLLLRRPRPARLLSVVARIPGPGWVEVQGRIAARAAAPPPGRDRSLVDLLEGSWIEQLLASRELGSDDGGVLPAIAAHLAVRPGIRFSGPRPRLLLTGRELVRRMGDRTRGLRVAPRLVCPHCLVRVDRIPDPLGLGLRRFLLGLGRGYVGCRSCGRARGLLPVLGPLIAVLDEERRPLDRTLAHPVDWLALRKPFDFDAVSIRRATDADVESFAIQVANDEDPVRRRRTCRARCVVEAECGLSENSLAVLTRTFPVVEVES